HCTMGIVAATDKINSKQTPRNPGRSQPPPHRQPANAVESCRSGHALDDEPATSATSAASGLSDL
ncbi:MAG: hypothetical protein ACK53L_19205, partial [Pirellulaceae bacterium]